MAGADAVKVFPARAVSPAYLGDLRAVLPDVRLMPTGGIELGDVRPWLDAGAWAVGLVLGLGSLLDAADVAPAVEAGAEFVVTFGCVPDLVAAAREASVPAVQGALTPGEVLAAHVAGADAVKVFPARAVSPADLGDLRAVLPDVRLMPTGGIELGDVRPWLDAGAWAVGLGSALGTVAAVGAGEVERRCRAALQVGCGRYAPA